jgi:integrase/recombinase XerC/integrase/recombinase XerD
MIAERFPTTKIQQSQLHILVQQFDNSMRFAKGTTRHVYRKALDQLLGYTKSNVFWFTPSDFSQFRFWLLNRKKLSNNTVNTYLTASRRFCEFLMELGILQRNPAWSVHGSAQDFKIYRVALAEVANVISRIDRKTVLGRRDYAFLSIIFECGATISELINADMGDMKKAGNSVDLWVKPRGSRGKFEVVSLTQSASDALYDYVNSRGHVTADEPLFSTVRAGTASKVRLSFRGVRYAMQKYLRFEGERTLRLDSLRTYCAVRLMTQGKSSDEIRSLMRFKSNMPFRKIIVNTKAIVEIK